MQSFELFYIPPLDGSLFVYAGIILNSGLLFRLKSAQQKYKKLDFADQLHTEEQRSGERDSSLEAQLLPQDQHPKREGSHELGIRMSNNVQPELRSQRKSSPKPAKSTFYTVSESMLHAYSAYYDNREPDVYKFGLVRVFTLYNDDRFLNGRRWALRCRLRYTLPGGADIELVRTSYVINSAIHKAVIQHSAGSWNDLRDHSSCRPHSCLKRFSGIVPGKVMEQPGTMRLAAYSTIHKAAGFTVPSNSMIWLVQFHHSTIPSLKTSMGEWSLGVIPASSFFGNGW